MNLRAIRHIDREQFVRLRPGIPLFRASVNKLDVGQIEYVARQAEFRSVIQARVCFRQPGAVTKPARTFSRS